MDNGLANGSRPEEVSVGNMTTELTGGNNANNTQIGQQYPVMDNALANGSRLEEASVGNTAAELTGGNNANNTQVIAITNSAIQIHLGLQSKELLVFRLTLRVLSLWCPITASMFEKAFYPLLVNIILLLMIVSDVNMMVTGSWKSINVYIYLAIDLGMYFNHVFGVLYFRSRDLEDNMLNLRLNTRHMNEFKTMLWRLMLGIILSYFFLTVFVLLFFNTGALLNGRFHCKSSLTFLKGVTNHIVCFLNYPTNIFGVGNSLALSWTMCIFELTCYTRLQQLHRNYVTWTGSTEDAIYDHLTNYARKVKTSCDHLGKWFVTHNIILIIAIPFLCYDIVKVFKGIEGNATIHTFLFLGYLIYTAVIWVVPLYFAELLQVYDEDLYSKVNEFCPGICEELEPELHTGFFNNVAQNPVRYTFHSRTEVNKFLTYLRSRNSGFLIGSYNFQFKLSMLSLFLAMIAFVTRVVG